MQRMSFLNTRSHGIPPKKPIEALLKPPVAAFKIRGTVKCSGMVDDVAVALNGTRLTQPLAEGGYNGTAGWGKPVTCH